MSETTKEAAGESHYYGSTAFNWATGPSRADVLAKLARMAGAETIKRNIKNQGGLYAWTVKVALPESSHYEIRNYAPYDVPTSEAREFRIQNTKGHSLPTD